MWGWKTGIRWGGIDAQCGALAFCPWRHSLGWCLAEGYRNGGQCHSSGSGKTSLLYFNELSWILHELQYSASVAALSVIFEVT